MFNYKIYWYHLKYDIPQYAYEGLLVVFCIGVILLLIRKGTKIGRDISILLLAEYIIFVFLSTVIFRAVKNVRNWDFTPFWSYDRPDLQLEIIINVVAFVPIGLLLGCSFRAMKWWKALIICGVISITIEFLQLFMKKGFTELDDVIHNTLGGMIGYGLFSLFRCGYEWIHKRRVAVL